MLFDNVFQWAAKRKKQKTVVIWCSLIMSFSCSASSQSKVCCDLMLFDNVFQCKYPIALIAISCDLMLFDNVFQYWALFALYWQAFSLKTMILKRQKRHCFFGSVFFFIKKVQVASVVQVEVVFFVRWTWLYPQTAYPSLSIQISNLRQEPYSWFA